VNADVDVGCGTGGQMYRHWFGKIEKVRVGDEKERKRATGNESHAKKRIKGRKRGRENDKS
jgi:hypothetical protein